MMKKLHLLVTALSIPALCLFTADATAQTDASPAANVQNIAGPENPATQALWDVEFTHNITASWGASGFAGVTFVNGQFWCSKWANDTIVKFNQSGAVVSSTLIPGLSGVRAMTTGGSYIYATNNSGTIYRIDPMTSLLAPPHITTAVTPAVRWATYDSTLNSGAGGFWIGNFSTDIYSIDMSGNQLSAIPAATHTLTGMYGAACDRFTAGGPYLWVFSQDGANNATVHAIALSTGTIISSHDAGTDVGVTLAATGTLAGGVYLTRNYVSGETTLIGVLQGAPNGLFGYELQMPVGVAENDRPAVQVFPNPATDAINIFTGNQEQKIITLTDLQGRVLTSFAATGQNCTLAMSAYAAGTYLVKVETAGNSWTEQIIKAE
jgi:hypothetical protein